MTITREQVAEIWAQHGNPDAAVPYAFVAGLLDALSTPPEPVFETARAIGRYLADRAISGLPLIGDVDTGETCGVYLLFDGDSVAYIGRSESVAYRLSQHRRSGRQFDAARVIPCDLERAIWLEKELIRALRPSQNQLRYERQARASERIVGGLQIP